MGQELIKRALDAFVFLINLTWALIKFVMTAALVPAQPGLLGGAGGVWGDGLAPLVQARPSSGRNPSVKPPGDSKEQRSRAALSYAASGGRGGPQSPSWEACPLALIPLARLVAAFGGHFNSPHHYEGPSPGSCSKGDC